MIKIGLISTCLIAWIALGANYYAQQCCSDALLPSKVVTVNLPLQDQLFQLSFPLLSVDIESKGAVLFKRNEQEPIVPERISESFIDVVKLLKVNPLFVLNIHTGRVDSEDPLIEDQRFNAIKTIFQNTGLPAYQINKGTNAASIDQENDLIAGLCSLSIAHIKPIHISDSSKNMHISIEDNISFALNGLDFLTKFNMKTRDQFQQMSDYLNSNKERQIIITGHYVSSEKNVSAFPNMGLARANKIRLLISSLGANGGQINIQSQLIRLLLQFVTQVL